MKDKAIVPLFLPVMYTLCNSKKSCDRTGGREALCPYCDKRENGQFTPLLPSSRPSFSQIQF